MTMLPDIDEGTYTDWAQDEFKRKQKEREGAFGFMQGVGDRIAQVSAVAAGAIGEAVGGAASAVGTTVDQQRQQLDAAIQAGIPSAAAPTAQAAAPVANVDPSAMSAQLDAAIARGTPVAQPVAQPPEATAGPDMMSQLNDVISRGTAGIGQAAQDFGGQADQLNQAIQRGLPSLEQANQPPLAAVQKGGDLHAYARQAAERVGIDADIFERQIQQESGFNPKAGSPAGAQGVAQIMPNYHPGVDTSDPYASLDYAANLMRSNLGKYGGDYQKALAAYNAGAGAVDKYGGVPPYEETQRYVSTILGAGGARSSPDRGGGVALGSTANQQSQFGDPQLSNEEAYAACGPAAAVRFAQRFGRNPSLREATDLAATVGWTAGQGMAGIGSEQALLNKLGVPTTLVQGAQWDKFAREAQTGNPVTISTQGHYFYADSYNPQTGQFHVGKSGTDLRGGSEWMTSQDMESRMGAVQGALFANNPTVAAPSTAGQVSGGASAQDLFGQAVTKAKSAAAQNLEALMQSTEEATTRGRSWADEQARNLDQAVQQAGQGLSATNQATPMDLRNGPNWKATEDTMKRLRGEEDVQLGPLTVPSRVAGAAGLTGEFLNEASPATHATRVIEGLSSAYRLDPEVNQLMNAMWEAQGRGDTATTLALQEQLDRRNAEITRSIGESPGGFSPGALYQRGMESPGRETAETLGNLAAGAFATGAAPKGLASGGKQFLASLALDPSGAPFSVASEWIAPGIKALGRLAGVGQTPAANIVADSAPEAQTLYQRLQDMPMLTADDAATALGSPALPQYLEGVVAYMDGQRQKLLAGELTNREVAKAWLLTLSSMQSRAGPETRIAGALGGVMDVPESAISTIGGVRNVRPEDATAAWMLTPEGRAALDSFETGTPTPEALEALERFRGSATFGQPMMTRDYLTSQKQGGQVLARNWFEDIPKVTAAINEAGRTGDMAALDEAVTGLRGIGPNKTAFIKQFLGMGNGVTVDSNEINWWLTGVPDAAQITDEATRKAVKDIGRAAPQSGIPGYLQQQLQDRFGELRAKGYGADVPEEAFNHVMHHWLWDTIKDAKTPHEALYEAMSRALVPTRKDSSLGGAARAALNTGGPLQSAIGGGIAGGYEAAQQPGATPQDILLGAAGGTALGAGRGALARGGIRTGRLAAIGGDVAGQLRQLEAKPYNADTLTEAYRLVTPQRIERVTSAAIDDAAQRISIGTPESMQQAQDLMGRVADEGTRMLQESQVTATGLGPQAMKRLGMDGAFSNKFNYGGNEEDVARITAEMVGKNRLTTPEQAWDFARREGRGQDEAFLGSTQLPGVNDPKAIPRVYAYETAGPPGVTPFKPAATIIWEPETPRAVSIHHGYGIVSPEASIHATKTPPGIKRAMYDPNAIRGAERIEGEYGPEIVNWKQGGIPVGEGRRIADTDLVVGHEGALDMRMATLLRSIPDWLAKDIQTGKYTEPADIAAVLLRETPPQQQPAVLEATRVAAGLGRELGEEEKSAFQIGATANRDRTESLVYNPQLENIKAIYMAGVPEDLTKKLPGMGKETRLSLAQGLRQQILDQTGKDVPILFKDMTGLVGPDGAAVGSKLIDSAEVLEGTRVPLAPGRGEIRERYMNVGMRDIGQATPRFATELGGAVVGGATGWQTSEGEPLPARLAKTAGGTVGGLVAGQLGGRLLSRAGRAAPVAGEVAEAAEEAAPAAASALDNPEIRRLFDIARSSGRAPTELLDREIDRLGRLPEHLAEQRDRLLDVYQGARDAIAAGEVPTVPGPRVTERTVPKEPGPTTAGPKIPSTGVPSAEPQLNIKLDKYVPEEVRQIIQDSFDANPQLMEEARRGTMSDDLVKNLANQVGRDPAEVKKILNKWTPGQAENAETLLALRQSLADQGQLVLAAQKKLVANPKSLDARTEMAEALARHGAVQEVVSGVTAEAGRALRQFRVPVEGQDVILQQMRRLAKAKDMSEAELMEHLARVNFSDPIKTARMAREFVKPSKWDKLTSLWYFGLLSSPTTHLRNVISNAVTAGMTPVESLGSAVADLPSRGLIRAIGGETSGRQRFAGEAAADIYGMGAGLGDGFVDAFHAMTREASAADLLAERAMPEAWSGMAGRIINAPGRALKGEDVFFNTLNQSAAAHRMAYRQASQEGKKGGDLISRIQEIVENPSEDFLKEMSKQGKYRTFQKEGGVADDLIRFRRNHPLARYLMPFVRTPINVLKYGAERSPLGAAGIVKDFMSKGGRESLRARGSGDLADRMSRAGIGTALMGGLGMWAYNNDTLTARAPDTPAERDAFYRQGKQPYSFKGPDGKWHSYLPLQPYAPLFAAAANIAKSIKDDPKGAPKDVAGIASLAALSAGQSLVDMPWTQGLADALDLISGKGSAGRDPQELVQRWLERQAAGTVPGAAMMRTLARAQDSTIREPDGVGLDGLVQAWQAGVPGLQQNVPPRLTAFGEPSRRPTSGLEAVINPFNSSSPTDSPVEKELEDLQLRGYDVEPGFVGKTMTVGGQNVELEPEQQAQYQRVSGRISYSVLQMLVGSKEWKSLDRDQKAKTVDKVISTTRDLTRKAMEPGMFDQAVEEAIRKYKRNGELPEDMEATGG